MGLLKLCYAFLLTKIYHVTSETNQKKFKTNRHLSTSVFPCLAAPKFDCLDLIGLITLCTCCD